MKIRVLAILCFGAFVFFGAPSCEEIVVGEEEEQSYFMKFYGDYHSDYLCDISANDVEEIILTGYRKTSENDRGWLIKTNSNGMVDWEKEFYSGTNTRTFGLHADETIRCAGFAEVTGSLLKEGFLCNYSYDGELLDSIPFSLQADAVKDMKFLQHGDNLRVMVHAHAGGSDQVYLYELTNGGELRKLSSNPLNAEMEGRLYFYEEENGDIYLAGSPKEADEDGQTNIMVSRLVDDNILWSYPYGEPGQIEKASGIVHYGDKLYIAVTAYAENDLLQPYTYLLTLNSYGVDADTTHVQLTGNNEAFSMIHHQDNQFVMVGKQVWDNKNSDVFMSIITTGGNMLLEQSYGNKGTSIGKFVKKLQGEANGFIIAGDIATSALSPDAVDVLVIKADENGEWIE